MTTRDKSMHVKHRESGQYIHISKMDNKWLKNLYRWFLNQGRQSDILAINLLAEISRRERDGIHIAAPILDGATSTTTSAPAARTFPTGDIEITDNEAGKMVFSRFGNAMVINAVQGQDRAIVTVSKSQAVALAIGILSLFNEEENLSLIAQQLNKVTEAMAAPQKPVHSLATDEEAW